MEPSCDSFSPKSGVTGEPQDFLPLPFRQCTPGLQLREDWSDGAGSIIIDELGGKRPRVYPLRCAVSVDAGSLNGTVTELHLRSEDSPPVIPRVGVTTFRSLQSPSQEEVFSSPRAQGVAADWSSPASEGERRAELHLRRAVGKNRVCGGEEEDASRDKSLLGRAILVACFSLAGLVTAVVSVWVAGDHVSTPRDRLAGDISVTLLTFVVCGAIIEYHFCAFAYEREHNIDVSFASGDGLTRGTAFGRGRLGPMMLEIIIHLPHPPPYFTADRFSVWLVSLMFLRLYTLVRLVGLTSPGYKLRFDVFDQLQLRGRYRHLRVGWFIGLKTLFLRYALTCWACFFALAVVSTTIVVYFAERDAQPQVFVDIWDSLWFVFVSYTTIGYGDLYPVSWLGRTATMLWGLVGLLLVQILTAICTLRLTPSPAEAEILSFLARKEAKGDLRRVAAALIQCVWREKRARAKNPHCTSIYHPSERTRRLVRHCCSARLAFRDRAWAGEQGLGIVVDLLKDQGRRMREFILATRTVGEVSPVHASPGWDQDLPSALLEEVREQRRLLEMSVKAALPPSSPKRALSAGQQQVLDALKEERKKSRRLLSLPFGEDSHELQEKVGEVLRNQQVMKECLDTLTDRLTNLEERMPTPAAPPAPSPAAPSATELQQQNEFLTSRLEALMTGFQEYRRVSEERQAWLETKLGAVLCNQQDHAEALDALRCGDGESTVSS